MQFTGEGTFTNEEGKIIGSGKISKANVSESRITFDFVQDDKLHIATLESNDGINYKGFYEFSHKPKGKAHFVLYQNKAGEYFLFGGYDGCGTADEGSGIWWIELRPRSKGAV
ncbi:MAG: hypothetical protein HQ575_05200 [Candidatus Omnitrophica bacterium]|nr:hypothetical protein [Candidatus Omnitrophota bacterium]